MMIRLACAAIALLAAVPAHAQTDQERLDARYDRALAAGYKALFLCSAIANAERNGTTRTPESVMAWELTGIQAPLDNISPTLAHTIHRYSDGMVSHVQVQFDEQMYPRFAVNEEDNGCSLRPLNYSSAAVVVDMAAQAAAIAGDAAAQAAEPLGSLERESKAGKFDGLQLNVVRQSGGPISTGGPFDGVFQRAFGSNYGEGARTTSVIVQQGDSSWERYAAGFDENTPQRTWSVAKSIAATLVGAAVQRSAMNVRSSAGLGASDADPRRAITIDHLLRMASGRYSDTPGNRTDPLYFGGSTVDETAAHWPLIHQPGTVFRYANNDSLMAVAVIAPGFKAHPPRALFHTLGMHSTIAETDWQGNYILSSQVWSTARDLAKLGQLYLDDGVLPGGERLLPENWLEYVSAPSGPQPAGEFGYGAGFWLFNKSPGIPPDTIAMQGNRGQYVVIVPSRDVVIVRRGEDPAGARFAIAAFARDVLAQMPGK